LAGVLHGACLARSELPALLRPRMEGGVHHVSVSEHLLYPGWISRRQFWNR